MATLNVLWRCLIGAPDPFIEAAKARVEMDSRRIEILEGASG